MNENQNEVDIPMNVEIEHNGKLYAFKSPRQKEILIIDENYEDIFICIEKSKEIIYRKMIEVYEIIKNPDNDDLVLMVLFMVDGQSYRTDYHINKISSELIASVIIPHMEKIEDYEFCHRAHNLYHQINR
jgi:hypothetical protein